VEGAGYFGNTSRKAQLLEPQSQAYSQSGELEL